MGDVPIPEKHRATTFQLTVDTVSPTRLASRDEDGNDIEETVSCYPHREMFVDKAGNLCDVLLCNSRTTARNPEARIYAATVREDWIRGGGLPLAECPHAPNGEYKRMVGLDRLVPSPKDYKACSGAPDGCEHLKALIEKRRKAQATKTQKQEADNARMTPQQLEQMGNVFGKQIADAMTARDRLRAGQGEKD